MSPFFAHRKSVLDQETIDFLQRVSSWAADLPVANIRGFAHVIDQGLQLVFGNIDLLPNDSKNRPIESNTANIFAFNCFVPAEEALVIIENACKTGELRIRGQPTILLFKRRSKFQSRFQDHWSGLNNEFPRTISLSVETEKIPNSARVGSAILNYELRAAAAPFDGLQDLYAKLSLKPPIGESGLLITAHSPISIVGTHTWLDGGRLTATIKATPNVNASRLTVGYSSLGTSYDQGLLAFCKREGDFLIFEADNLHAHKYKVFANYSGDNLDEKIVIARHANPIATLLEIFDKSLAHTTSSFFDTNNPTKFTAERFEISTSLLFSLLGFSVLPLHASKQLDDAPDLTFAVPNYGIGIVECTLRDLNNNNKLSKLDGRTKRARERLNDTGNDSLVVLPIIVSALPRSELQSDLELAKKYNICVIAKDDLEALLTKIWDRPDPRKQFDEFLCTTR